MPCRILPYQGEECRSKTERFEMGGKCGLGSLVQISVGYSLPEEGTCIISISFFRHPTDFSGPVFFCPKLTRVRNKPFEEGYPLVCTSSGTFHLLQ